MASACLPGTRYAYAALELALDRNRLFALPMEESPSCGIGFLYEGSFTGHQHAAEGVAATLLRCNGVTVFSPNRIAELAAAMEA